MIELHVNGTLGTLSLSLSLRIARGEFFALTGASGSGKTTLLRIISGLERIDNARIVVENEIWQDAKRFLPPQKRRIGFVFQEYALFENMSVEENLLFVHNDKSLAARLLDIIDMYGKKSRYPKMLSGGEKQRVALARALMRRPKLLLLDEPLAALDGAMRKKLQEEIAAIHKEFGTTTVLVSHDIGEIYRLASRVATIKNGTVTALSDVKSIAKVHDELIVEGIVVSVDSVKKETVIKAFDKLFSLPFDKQEPQIGEQIRIAAATDGLRIVT